MQLVAASAPAVVAGAAALGVWLSGWRGVDHPAHHFRVALYREYGPTLWNTQWFGGHHTLGYGVLFPALAGPISIAIVGIASTVAAVGLFGAILRRLAVARPTAGTVAFAFLMVVNFFEGRLPFALGLALALAALLVALHRRWVPAAVLALLAGLAAPLAAAFLALACGAWALADAAPRWWRVGVMPQSWIAAAGLAPATFLALVFPEGGRFPFIWSYFVLTLLGAVAAMSVRGSAGAGQAATPAGDRMEGAALAIGGALVAVAAVLFFFVPNPIGANLSRLAVLGGPILLAVAAGRHRRLSLVALVLIGWQCQPLLDLPAAIGNPSDEIAYHQPLIDAVLARSDGPVRIEVPFTERHWETAHIAPEVALARGWQRQLDYRFNDDTLLINGLDDERYRAWLEANGVTFVAVPDVGLEQRSRTQARLAAESPGLEEVWANRNWVLYEVTDAVGLIEPIDGVDARLVVLEPDRFEVEFTAPGTVLVRVRHSQHMAVSSGNGCTAARGEWTAVQATTAGRVVVGADWFGGSEVCTIAAR
ncbi:MAG: hypothetical protein HKN26_01600 [Acidimicrobiales bacterium]|nr:hypothetical protein [Acidimicrobiales bacterium]